MCKTHSERLSEKEYLEKIQSSKTPEDAVKTFAELIDLDLLAQANKLVETKIEPNIVRREAQLDLFSQIHKHLKERVEELQWETEKPVTEEGIRTAIRTFLEIFEKQGYTIQETEDLLMALCLDVVHKGTIEGRD